MRGIPEMTVTELKARLDRGDDSCWWTCADPTNG